MRIFVIGGLATADADVDAHATLVQICQEIGRSSTTSGHSLVLCSPFEGSADLEVMRGLSACPSPRPQMELFFPDTLEIRARIDSVTRELTISSVALNPAPPPSSAESHTLAWLYCQIQALDRANVVIAVGGRSDGAANMLLNLVAARRRPLLPCPLLAGAAAAAYFRHQYELADRLGPAIEALQDRSRVAEWISLAETLAARTLPTSTGQSISAPVFFISYPRARPAEADHVETLLRRRQVAVFRDETDFGAGHEVPFKIREAIHRSTIFVALWCSEYACSPHCIDELELALERRGAGQLDLWLLCVDKTRMVPRKARDLLYFQVRTREELEGRVIDLLDKLAAQVAQS